MSRVRLVRLFRRFLHEGPAHEPGKRLEPPPLVTQYGAIREGETIEKGIFGVCNVIQAWNGLTQSGPDGGQDGTRLQWFKLVASEARATSVCASGQPAQPIG